MSEERTDSLRVILPYATTPSLVDTHLLHGAAVCSELSLKAYPDEAGFPTLHPWDNVWRFREADAHGVIAFNRHDVVIAFSGTKNLEEWLQNLSIAGFKQGNFEVSRGPWEYALHCVKGLLDTLSLRNQNVLAGRNLLYCGHSLGGCAAILAFLAAEVLLSDSDLRSQWLASFSPQQFLPRQIFTYGAPRCISWSSAAVYPWPVTNMRLIRDVAPHLPLEYWHRRTHPGRSIWLRDNGDVSAVMRPAHFLRLMGSWISRGLTLGALRKWHSQRGYVKALSRYIYSSDWRSILLGIPANA